MRRQKKVASNECVGLRAEFVNKNEPDNLCGVLGMLCFEKQFLSRIMEGFKTDDMRSLGYKDLGWRK